MDDIVQEVRGQRSKIDFASLTIPGVAQVTSWFSMLCPFFLLLTLLFIVAGVLYCRSRRLKHKALAVDRALAETKHIYRMLATHAGAVVWETDREGRYTFVGNTAKDVFGYAPEVMIGKHFYDLTPASHREEVKEFGLQCARLGTKATNYENPILHKDGRELWVSTVALPRKDAQDNVIGVYGLDIDITQRIRAERALEERLKEAERTRLTLQRTIENLQRSETERTRLARAVEASPESIVITDAEGVIEYVNPAFEKITGYSPTEAKGRNPRILKSGEHEEAFYADMWRTISSGKIWKRHLVNRHKSGRLFNEEATISSIYDNDGKISGYVAIKRDVTQDLKREHMQQQSQKMESIGRLAGGMAHDFNNMLQVILGNVELAIESAGENELLVDDLQQARKAAKQSVKLTGNLLAFASRESISPKVINLDDMVRNSVEMLRRLLHEGIKLDLNSGNNENRINMDPTQLNQILINLCLNARDAIEERGRIEIVTGRRRLKEQDVLIMQNPTPGDYAVLTIADDGCGMDERTRDQAFEPFFTTKQKGKGTGLGLPTVYGIMKQNDGYIDCRSAPGQGTRFDLYFPLCEKLPLTETEEVSSSLSTGQGECILVVEDEVAVLRITELILKKYGYRVWSTHSPHEALEWVVKQGDPINMLLTDVVMPEMDGKQLAAKISKVKPGIRCVFMSGYPDDFISRNDILPTETAFLAKPFDAAQLLSVVRNALDQNPETQASDSKVDKARFSVTGSQPRGTVPN